MFTGLIEEVGTIVSVNRRNRIVDIIIEAQTVLDDIKTGDSIAISGACLTVTGFTANSFTVQAVEETLRRTKLGKITRGIRVNLERALRIGDRFGGHLVQGHVDGTGRIVSKKGQTDNILFSIAPEAVLERYIVEKGSITIDGISLTVTYIKKGEFGVSVIPHTLDSTTLKDIQIGDKVNLETDMISKYIEKLLMDKEGLTINRLKELGF